MSKRHHEAHCPECGAPAAIEKYTHYPAERRLGQETILSVSEHTCDCEWDRFLKRRCVDAWELFQEIDSKGSLCRLEMVMGEAKEHGLPKSHTVWVDRYGWPPARAKHLWDFARSVLDYERVLRYAHEHGLPNWHAFFCARWGWPEERAKNAYEEAVKRWEEETNAD